MPGLLHRYLCVCDLAFAAPGDACGVATHLVQADAGMPRVAAAVKAKTLNVVVFGTGSSTLPGPNGQAAAYPARLEAALQKKLPDVKVKVISLVKSRQTAADMAETFPKVLKDEKPQLVIWQTGTADAMRGVATDEFQTTLEQAIDEAARRRRGRHLHEPAIQPAFRRGDRHRALYRGDPLGRA